MRLTPELVTWMREQRARGVSFPSIEKATGLAHSTVYSAVMGGTWKRLPMPPDMPAPRERVAIELPEDFL